MRVPRTLVAVAMAASLLATPALATAQPADPTGGPATPLARQPDGHLPLEGTPWRLEGYHDGDRDGVPGPEVAAFLVFTAGAFEGSGGCSTVRGRYGVAGSALSIKRKPATGRACAENLALVQRAVEHGLTAAASYAVEAGATFTEDKLVIRSVSGNEVLRYGLDDLALLDAAEWRLESYTSDGETVPASADMPALLSFRPEADAASKRRQSGPLSGSSGCNGIVAEFYRHADVLSFSELQLTDAPCTPELVAQEAAVTAVLDATAILLDLPYERLVLTSLDSGERLELVSQAPFEGTTWWLEGPGAAVGDNGSPTDLRVTLRLDEGMANGEGPCGPYSARYVTDGAFITFSDVRGARDDECAEQKAERALISGLRRSVIVARSSDGLDFEDAGARSTLTFSRPFAP